MLEEEGKPLSELMKQSLQENFRDTLRAVSSFTPKELEVTRKPGSIEEMTDDELDQLASLASAVLSKQSEGDEGVSASELDRVH